jgi:hypothetical protein
VSDQLTPLGALIGARSGDKGGAANLGVWIRDPVEDSAVAAARGDGDLVQPSADRIARADARYAWLCNYMTVERIKALLPEARDLRIERYEFANLRALNFVFHGLLGRGVAETTRWDPQAKGLGEHLRARLAPIPGDLLEERR